MIIDKKKNNSYLIQYIRIVSSIKWSPAQFEVQHDLDISTVFVYNYNDSQQKRQETRQGA